MKESAAASITPPDSPHTLEDYMAGETHRVLAAPDVEVGRPAYDFELPVYDISDGTRRATGATFHLQDVAANQPVALIFGSYT